MKTHNKANQYAATLPDKLLLRKICRCLRRYVFMRIMNQRLFHSVIFLGLFPVICFADEKGIEEMARNFMELIRLGEYEQAFQYVHPDKLHELERDIEITEDELSYLPPLPDNFVITFKVNEDEGYFIVDNWSPKTKINLKYIDGKWWIYD